MAAGEIYEPKWPERWRRSCPTNSCATCLYKQKYYRKRPNDTFSSDYNTLGTVSFTFSRRVLDVLHDSALLKQTVISRHSLVSYFLDKLFNVKGTQCVPPQQLSWIVSFFLSFFLKTCFTVAIKLFSVSQVDIIWQSKTWFYQSSSS